MLESAATAAFIFPKSTLYVPVASSRVNAPISWKKLKRVMLARPWAFDAPKRTERKIPAMKVT